ncbi:MAG TPA: ureidoglycolate lyase [Steroidobacteraceae bacterium]|nr:ureidoglycolate lyase [Steroidobacteraceae bacterium]
MSDIILKAAPLTAAAFAPFGDVIEIAGRRSGSINEGTCERFDDLAQVDVLAAGGRPLISIFKAVARRLPFHVKVLERHPLSSQAFMPLDGLPFLVVVAEDGATPLSGRIRAYRSSGTQGVNYRRNTWHHALLALERTSHFLVVDRGGAAENCEEMQVDDAVVVVTT